MSLIQKSTNPPLKYYIMSHVRGLSFSLKRALGISGLKTKIARKTRIPTTKGGLERKIGRGILNLLKGKKHHG